jgi:hypothetical protein
VGLFFSELLFCLFVWVAFNGHAYASERKIERRDLLENGLDWLRLVVRCWFEVVLMEVFDGSCWSSYFKAYSCWFRLATNNFDEFNDGSSRTDHKNVFDSISGHFVLVHVFSSWFM